MFKKKENMRKIISITSYAYLRKTNFFEIDTCLDCGGRWDYQTEKCDTAFLPVNLPEY